MADPVKVMGPYGPVIIPARIMGHLTPDPAYHYGAPLVSQATRDGSICVYLSGNGPLGDRVNMVALQPGRCDQGCVVRTLAHPGDRELHSVTVFDDAIYLEAPQENER